MAEQDEAWWEKWRADCAIWRDLDQRLRAVRQEAIAKRIADAPQGLDLDNLSTGQRRAQERIRAHGIYDRA